MNDRQFGIALETHFARLFNAAYPDDCFEGISTEEAEEAITEMRFDVKQWYGSERLRECLTVYLDDDYTVDMSVDEDARIPEMASWKCTLRHPSFGYSARVLGADLGRIDREGDFEAQFLSMIKAARAEMKRREEIARRKAKAARS